MHNNTTNTTNTTNTINTTDTTDTTSTTDTTNSINATRDRDIHNRNADILVRQLEMYFKKLKISYHVVDESENVPEPVPQLQMSFGRNTTSCGNKTSLCGTDNAAGIICIEHVHIDREIKTVKDLLSLCDEFRVAENVRYNIDMASLHKICPYLRELDNMIGMQTIKTTVIDQIIYFIQHLHVPSPGESGPVSASDPVIVPISAIKSIGGPFHTPALDAQTAAIPPLFQYIPPIPSLQFGGEMNPFPNASASIASIFSNLQPQSSKSNTRIAPVQNLNNNSRKMSGDFMHTVLYGPPGTGKTEVAKILGNIFSHLGILKANTFKKVTRSDLIAGYLGQTAIKTRDVINSAIGGVLFIDEAYALGNTEKRDSFSKECIDTLCEALSDHKHDLMVIIAGYEKELTDCFFSYNEGLNSRFTWRYKIDNYSAVDLRKIFEKIVRDHRWAWSPLATDAIKDAWFKLHYDYFKYFGRDIEVFFTKTKIAHSRRIFCRPDAEKRILIMKDLECGFELFSQNEDIKMRGTSFNGAASTLYL